MQLTPKGLVLSQGVGRNTALIHGALSSRNAWHGQLPGIIHQGRTISYPLPGHYPWIGSKSQIQRLLHPIRLADAYAASLQRDFNGTPIDLIGHSTGGFVALTIAARHPHLVNKVAIIGGFADGRYAGACGFVRSYMNQYFVGQTIVRSTYALWLSNPMMFRRGIAAAMTRPPKGMPKGALGKAMEGVRDDLRRSPIGPIMHAAGWLEKTDLTNMLPEVRRPSLVVAGSLDPVVEFEHQRLVSAHLPRARLLPMTGIGHLPMIEAQRQFNCKFADWCLQPAH